MKKLSFDKSLISIAKKFVEHSKKIPSKEFLKDSIFYDKDNGQIFVTDGHKLLTIPDKLPIVSANLDSFLAIPSHIFNFKFYEKYSKAFNVSVSDNGEFYVVTDEDGNVISTPDNWIENTYPDCKRVLDCTCDFSTPKILASDIIKKLKSVVKQFKEFNSVKRLKKEEQYDLREIYIKFTNFEAGFNKSVLKGEICIKDPALNDVIKDKVILDMTLTNLINNYDFVIGCTAVYLLDSLESLSKIDDFVTLNFKDSRNPIKITNDYDALVLLMPVRLKEIVENEG